MTLLKQLAHIVWNVVVGALVLTVFVGAALELNLRLNWWLQRVWGTW